MFDALGGLPLGGIPEVSATPTPPTPSGGVSSHGGGAYYDRDFSRRWRREENKDELAILLAAYEMMYGDE